MIHTIVLAQLHTLLPLHLIVFPIFHDTVNKEQIFWISLLRITMVRGLPANPWPLGPEAILITSLVVVLCLRRSATIET